MNWSSLKSSLKRHHYLVPVLVATLAPALVLHAYFWHTDEYFDARYGPQGPENDPALAHFFDSSLFDSEDFGGQDVTFLFLIASGGVYLASLVPRFERQLGKYRVYAAVVLVSSACTYLLNLSFKTFFARPRPGDVRGRGEPFVHAFELGTIGIEDAYHSSFMSGHTLAAGLLFIIPFCLLGLRGKKRGFAVAAATIAASAWTTCMGISRVHDGAHWASDVLWAQVVTFLSAWVFYTRVIRVPDQERLRRETPAGDGSPPVGWEIRLLVPPLLVEVGFFCVAMGVKEIIVVAVPLVTYPSWAGWWGLALAAVGAVAAWGGFKMYPRAVASRPKPRPPDAPPLPAA